MEDLFLKKETCPLCDKEFSTPRLRRSKYRPVKVDTDYCTYYKGPNPLFYSVMICPHCGYAYTENFSSLRSKEKEALLKKISPLKEDYNQERNLEMAIETYKRALLVAMMKGEKHSVLAGLNLHLAWLYRFAQDNAREEEFMKRARDNYLKVYEKEDGEGQLAKLLYLLGELNRRLGDIREAGRWFSRVINDQSINDKSVIRMARERWQDLRQDEGGS